MYIFFTFIHTVYVCILFYIYVDIQHHFVVTAPDTPETHTYIEINLEHLIFQAVCMGLGPEKIVIAWIANPLTFSKTFCIKKIRTSFLCQPTILDFAFWVFIIECNGEPRRQPAKNAGVLATE